MTVRHERLDAFTPCFAWSGSVSGCGARRRTAALLATAGYLATIPTANWLTTRYPAAPVAPGVLAPAGVYVVGLTLVMRDVGRELAGRTPVAMAMVGGVVLSYWTANETVATASAAAYVLSESLDFAAYEWLRNHGFTIALAISNTVGLIADSALFLSLAFGSLHYLPGQLIGKAWMTGVAVVLLLLRRRAHHGAHRRARSLPGTPTAEARSERHDAAGHGGLRHRATLPTRPQPGDEAAPEVKP
ncbi:VUT family protein [Streptomyces fulvoviolaceus]|uniref:VUT family protein n=1 Tax=Streptomyces fulvoviolaceus TaxID=285535 RepID=UPI0021BEB4CE|nr:VUT family protein [Streptomyces fulvoviolaceus]MCT9075234.1 VUT family protein [Streptomyces fulvoviolaceus]